MADPIDTPSGVGAERTGGERARMILAELADAAQSAALSVVEAQRARAATKVADIATAMHAAAHSLEQSSNPAVAECAAACIAVAMSATFVAARARCASTTDNAADCAASANSARIILARSPPVRSAPTPEGVSIGSAIACRSLGLRRPPDI